MISTMANRNAKYKPSTTWRGALQLKPCLNQATINQTDVETCVEAAAAAGFEGVEFRLPKLQAYAARNHSSEELRKLLADREIESVCLNALEDFSNVPADDFDAVLHRAREFSTICRQSGSKMFVCCPSPLPHNLTKPEAISMTVDRLRKIAQVSAEYSVGVAFEFLAEASASTLQDGVEIIDAAGVPNLGLIIDTYHYYAGRSTLEAFNDFPLDRLWAVHFNDVEPGPLETLTDEKRLLPGRGIIHLDDIARWLKEHGWDGWFSVELFREEYWKRDPYEVAKESLNSLKPYL
jgi:2-keto-myo-inositol isomerase